MYLFIDTFYQLMQIKEDIINIYYLEKDVFKAYDGKKIVSKSILTERIIKNL